MTYCGQDCCARCPRLEECGGCEKTNGHPFGGNCAARETEDFGALKSALTAEINALGIDGLKVNDLNLLNGFYVNLEYPLPGGSTAKFLKDNDVYLGNQIEKPGSERCFGVVACLDFILVCEYGCGGTDPELIMFRKRH